MQRVVITGMGIVSSIGNNCQEVSKALREGRSGITRSAQFAEYNFRSQVWGMPTVDTEAAIDRKLRRFMGVGSQWNYIAMLEAIASAKLDESLVSNNPDTALIMGSGGPSTSAIARASSIIQERKGTKRIGPFEVPKAMSSTASACMSVPFKIHGASFSVTSACSTSAHAVILGTMLIKTGMYKRVFVGGSEELDASLACLFDAMPAMSMKRNHAPETASRAYDIDRDGFVIAGGAGVLVLESLNSARERHAPIYGAVHGCGMSSDGVDMFAPSGEGAVRCMRMAIADAHANVAMAEIGYINTHGTATEKGDEAEIGAIREVFGTSIPDLSSTKSMTGHSLGAAGVQETIYGLLAMNGGFLPPSINIENLDPNFEGVPIVRRPTDKRFNAFLSNSFGFGGTNATLVMGMP